MRPGDWQSVLARHGSHRRPQRGTHMVTTSDELIDTDRHANPSGHDSVQGCAHWRVVCVSRQNPLKQSSFSLHGQPAGPGQATAVSALPRSSFRTSLPVVESLAVLASVAPWSASVPGVGVVEEGDEVGGGGRA